MNQRLFEDVYASLLDQQVESLNDLLETTDDAKRSGYNALKSLPKNPTISNFRDLLKHHDCLTSFGDMKKHLNHIIPIKLKQVAEQARSLDASDLKDFSAPKRYALILSLIHRAQTRSKDALAITFCRTILSMHKKAKDRLENLREFYRTRTQELLTIFSEVLDVMKSEEKNEVKLTAKTRDKVDDYVGIDILKNDCDEAVALNSNNHIPFLIDFFTNKRGTLLRLIETLELRSSTQENTLINAIQRKESPPLAGESERRGFPRGERKRPLGRRPRGFPAQAKYYRLKNSVACGRVFYYILKNKDKRDRHLANELDLSFTTDHWRKTIIKKENGQSLFHHRYLELCVLSHVADELRSKDLFIVGSDSYADYREDLLPMIVCEKRKRSSKDTVALNLIFEF